MSTTDHKEGDQVKCGTCGEVIIYRMSEYANYTNRLQWQTLSNKTAHNDKNGDCKTKGTPKPETKPEPKKEETQKINLTASTLEDVKNETILLFNIRLQVIATLKEIAIDPHPGMIWEMTALIFKKHFGGVAE